MDLIPRILQASDLEQLYQLQKAQCLAQSELSEMEFEMSTWAAPWRKEALEFYLPLGWSFGLFAGDKAEAFALAQPQLFVHGLTQNLWVEHLFFRNAAEARSLLDLLYRTCREKHFQSIRLKDSEWIQYLPQNAKPVDESTEIHSFKTAKF